MQLDTATPEPIHHTKLFYRRADLAVHGSTSFSSSLWGQRKGSSCLRLLSLLRSSHSIAQLPHAVLLHFGFLRKSLSKN